MKNQRIPNHDVIIEFAGRNGALLQGGPNAKRRRAANAQREEQKNPNAGAAPKRVIKITVGLKEWLANKQHDAAFVPWVPQAPEAMRYDHQAP